MTPLQATTFRTTLVHALTRYDKQQAERAAKNPRANYNVHALPQYIARLDDIMDDIARGADPAAAITAGFTGPLANACLRAVKLAKVDNKPSGAWHYVPESDR